MDFQLSSINSKTAFVGGLLVFACISLFGVLGTFKDIEYNKTREEILKAELELKATQQESFAQCMQAYQLNNSGANVYSSDANRCKNFVMD